MTTIGPLRIPTRVLGELVERALASETTQLCGRSELTVEDAIELRTLLADYRTRGQALDLQAAQRVALEQDLAKKVVLLQTATGELRAGIAELNARTARINDLVLALHDAQSDDEGRARVKAEHTAWVAARPQVES